MHYSTITTVIAVMGLLAVFNLLTPFYTRKSSLDKEDKEEEEASQACRLFAPVDIVELDSSLATDLLLSMDIRDSLARVLKTSGKRSPKTAISRKNLKEFLLSMDVAETSLDSSDSEKVESMRKKLKTLGFVLSDIKKVINKL